KLARLRLADELERRSRTVEIAPPLGERKAAVGADHLGGDAGAASADRLRYGPIHPRAEIHRGEAEVIERAAERQLVGGRLVVGQLAPDADECGEPGGGELVPGRAGRRQKGTVQVVPEIRPVGSGELRRRRQAGTTHL